MKYQEFLDYVQTGIQKIMGDSATVNIIQVNKNNGIVLDGLVIRGKDRNISPTIYLNLFYEQYQKGKAKTDIVNEIYQIYHKYSGKANVNIDELMDYDKIRKNIAYKLVNFEKNKNRLEHMPYVRFLDMAIIFFVKIPGGEDEWKNATFQVCEEHLKMWKIDIGDLYRDALYHTPDLLPAQICCLEDMLMEMIWDREQDNKEYEAVKKEFEQYREEGQEHMYVLTNQMQLNGAACILYKNVLHEFGEKMKSNFYIIPSSIHEVLLVPYGGVSAGDLKKMVSEVNERELAEEEILSDNIYYYDWEKDTIKLILE
ncbi:MAG: DUF5688 family protein [Lachnospiraceae bacterium]|nr:DUF5688 family protein [Lachnospiraceae bacterium]